MTYNQIKSNIAIIASILIIIGALGILLGLVWPALIDLNAAKQEREQKREEKTAKENLVERIRILAIQFDSLAPGLLERIERAIPRGQNVPDVLIQLESMASESNLILDSVDFTSAAAQIAKTDILKAKSLTASLVLKGDYPAFSRWLDLFESNARLFDIRSVDFNLSSTESNLFTLKIKFLIYYQ
jgi:Tfp pilus assembly protein PilO